MENRKRIFIINNEIDLCLLLKVYFVRKNYQVFISHSICDALLHIKEYQPNTIFVASAACQNPKEDIKKIKELAPEAEVILDNYNVPGGV